ncbi:tyrosine decarboxylase MfnA [Methanococcus voltae]|uniref:Probable L-tyrosine/L-aspartate decarboxylase n=1 Tax=Methanococcus voltae (strain ATCC BAA-1334 / A3) TaxID=456320 RepID=D7DV28_METV3|nr:tyrosine decarboxylase MfnA [Methanococcus voltae]MCS3900793.1 tyrosine decarboxylase/aspartate 1-decarboxylase [Methanococcus voltae]
MDKSKEILSKLKEYRDLDLKYEKGNIFGSMCTKPHPITLEIIKMFYETNLGDPGLFIGTKKLEEESIQMIGKLLHNPNAFGYIISGGTEANITAMRLFNNISKANFKNKKYGNKKNREDSSKIIIPETAHFSFDKSKDMMNLDLIRPPLTEYYTSNVKWVKDYVEDTISKNGENSISGIVGIAGCTELGTIDNIKELSKIAYTNDIPLHVDAAFGGFVIPFLEEKYKLKNYNYEFDFSLDGVKTITIDPHKMGLSPISAGGIIFRNREYKKYLDIEAPYLTETLQATILGTRTGVGAATTWGLLKLLCKDGYAKITHECMEKTTYLTNKLRENGFETVIEPVLNIIAIKDDNAKETCKKLKEKGLYVSVCRCTNALRIVIMPHLEFEHLDNLVNTLCKINKK